MTEPPKPITRLAELIDRSGPRRPNRLASVAGRLCGYTWAAGWLMGMLTLVLVLVGRTSGPLVGQTLYWIWRIFLWTAPLAGLASIVVAIVALTKARAAHLQRSGAILAIVWSCLGLLLWLSIAGTFAGMLLEGLR